MTKLQSKHEMRTPFRKIVCFNIIIAHILGVFLSKQAEEVTYTGDMLMSYGILGLKCLSCNPK